MDGAVGVYVHWPFCLAKCPYCDFNSHVRDSVDQHRWRAAVLAEIDHFANLLAARGGAPRHATSIFFGGGTPSLMDPRTVAEVIARVHRHWPPAAPLEITLEANPTSSEAGRFAAYRDAGVNRLSLGVQALNDADLVRLGRRHDAAEARAALTLAQRTVARTSFDLIYGRPGQTLAQWRRELGEAIGLAGDHAALYQLTLEPGTPFHAEWRRGRRRPLDDDMAAALYDLTQEVMDKAGLAAYEISNHARAGAECRHNLNYWRFGEYVGVGPGAHGRLRLDAAVHATRQSRNPEYWLESVERRGHATEECAPIEAARRHAEILMMGLRLADGIAAADYHRATGSTLAAVLKEATLDRLVKDGFLVSDAVGLRATAKGRRVLDAVLAEMLG